MNADLVVSGGTVVDGTGAPAYQADVAVAGGRVVAVGADATSLGAGATTLGAGATTVLDARDCLVTPGFIDVHTHYDPQATWDPWLTPSDQLGVTSVVAGNCGFSIAPCRPSMRPLMMRTLEAVEDIPFASMDAALAWEFETYPQYLAFLRRRGVGINFGGYVGHTAVRLYVMGDDAYERAARPDEIASIRAVVREAVAGGALGFSSDRAGYLAGDRNRPVPSVVASPEETEALCFAAAEAGRGIVHIAPGDRYEWIYELAPRLGCTVTWSAILAYPPGKPVNWTHKLGFHTEQYELGGGRDVHPQVTSRVLTFEFSLENPITLTMLPAFGELGGTSRTHRVAAFNDPAWRERARRQADALPVNWAALIVDGSAASDPEAGGKSVQALATRRGVHPLDAIVDLSLTEDLRTRLRVEAANTDPVAMTALLTAPGCILGLSDAGAHVGQLCDAVLPLHFLSAWVRDRGLMSIEDGVRRVTGEIAGVVGLEGRGTLRVGDHADIAVLEWSALGPGPVQRTRDLPGGAARLVATEPQGLRHVLVNGSPIRRDHRRVEDAALRGEILEPKRYAPTR